MASKYVWSKKKYQTSEENFNLQKVAYLAQLQNTEKKILNFDHLYHVYCIELILTISYLPLAEPSCNGVNLQRSQTLTDAPCFTKSSVTS